MEKTEVRIRRKRHPIIIIVLLLFFFLLYFILQDAGMVVPKKRIVLVNEPYNFTKEVTYTEQRAIPACENRSFRYSTEGGNVDSIGNSVRPNLVMHNLENQWGEYKVNFSFIDESRYPYDRYGGQNLAGSIASGNLGWDDGDFFSVTYKFMMPPGEAVLMDDLTEKKDPAKSYWAIANIIEPRFEYCYDRIERFNVTQNRSFIEYRKSEKMIRVNEYTRIFDIMKVDSFGEWVIIVFMFFLILLLAVRIIEQRKIRRELKRIEAKENERSEGNEESDESKEN